MMLRAGRGTFRGSSGLRRSVNLNFSSGNGKSPADGIPAVQRSQRANKRDITGSKLSLSVSRDGLTYIDEAIMNMITSQEDPLPQIRECLRVDEDCALAHALLVLELTRNPILEETPGEGANLIKTSLQNMESNFIHLNERERYMGAAGLQCARGNYSEAASLLESAILLNPGDAISLRLAQDCYMLAGDARNALSCVTRCLQTMDDSHFLHGHLMGMMAAGYVETGRYYEAEETSSRAVARTKGRDLTALQALLSTLQLTGRSSELLGTLEKHEDKYEGAGLVALLFNKGCAYVQRGNYRGATRTYDLMLDLITDGNPPVGSVTPLTYATCLLWQVSLYNQDKGVLDRWHADRLTSLWQAVPLVQCSPLHALARTLSLSIGAMEPADWQQLLALDQSGRREANTSMKDKRGKTGNGGDKQHDGADGADGADGDGNGGRTGGGMEGILSWLTKQQVRSTEDADVSVVTAASAASAATAASAGQDGGDFSTETQAAGETEQQQQGKRGLGLERGDVMAARRAALDVHMAALQAEGAGGSALIADDDGGDGGDGRSGESWRLLGSIQPSFTLATRPPEVSHRGRAGLEKSDNNNNNNNNNNNSSSSTSDSERSWLFDTCLRHAATGLVEQTRLDYGASAHSLNGVLPVLHRMGGTMAVRDVMAQTLILFFLRAERLVEARLLLCERTTLTPNDAQAWRRLALVFDKMNERDLAEIAHYTAWQLGIGQGGFGGPK